MKIVIQKVKEAKVVVDQAIVGEIKQGYMLLVGMETGDSDADIKKAVDKIASIRLFDDAEGKINLSIQDVGGAILSISQFTLAADCRKGNRPSFSNAMEPTQANTMFEAFNTGLRNHGLKVETGIFQTHMNVILDNDGPITIMLNIKDGKVI
ncbi:MULTISPECIES: D-aminoacyl-tRNA deacylase [Erysipelothrix]|uniref:D-aminoacyl-tRNA deacylase n=1 Tax=Erysipelothrix piscisicarius TaxID=2485784 RepID=A0A3S5HK35_9FIRM|nr:MULTISPECIES: D-aminoacyl-tRNA deacylase [Erysipelothrix]AZK43714.1 D-tyrosyl-tRNA(Tyr) deacylase [Erysipelothrix piscisicarius]MBK2402165.1 D-tyrosyl-tRNA(Tyr) deacylase [Erysipelothrix sp. strain 2 (EsS2-6-Brazil)]NBA01201.1 D-tyrosyl-tRNA(Tyr) deacylase [Erysipelothrix rhusiopathiae]